MADRLTLHHGDCLQVLRGMADASVDSIVCDPPAGIAFMGKEWDKDKGGRDAWIAWMQSVAQECLRVIKPGGHALVWALPRTSHWTGMAWENAGWEPRDKIVHLFGTGFPKSHNLKGEWDGWGTALKPASEDWWLLRKPLDGTVATNVLKHGTGALNIDGCRVAHNEDLSVERKTKPLDTQGEGWGFKAVSRGNEGRWPANVMHDGSDEVVAGFPADEGRFFYCSKASTTDRNEGLEHLPEVQAAGSPMRSADGEHGGEGLDGTSTNRLTRRRNTHPTVKSTELMRYLTRLITPVGGLCLDPFMGSGSTGKACMLEGFRFIGIEKDPEYVEIARARIEFALRNGGFVDEVEVKPAPKAGSSLKVLRRKVSDEQIDLFAQPIASM